nr:rRNA maturation RNase YbeY [uncultured Celeribacter sp.]
MTVDVICEDTRWETAGLEGLAETAETAVLRYFGADPEAFETAVLACDDTRIAILNSDFRDKPTATNVLSWPSQERATPGDRPPLPEAELPGMEIELGDIAIAYDTCAREAREQDKSFADHVTHLLIHGVLHLLGYDHISDADAEIMEAIETEILATLGIKDPY